MKNHSLIFSVRIFLLACYILSGGSVFSGCIRFVGKADCNTKQVGFDTQNQIKRDEPEGNVTT